MTTSDILKTLEIAIEMQKNESYTYPAIAKDHDALGVMVAHYCGWSSDKLRKVIYSMLEDANFHELNSQIDELWDGKKVVVK